MQTSTIMLDSALSKILATKQVESSMQVDNNNADNDDRQVANEESHVAETTIDTPAFVNNEAEVRLVIRFTVEEQIVYKGKVERVNQLDSEELSRVVSRVAWEGANENDRSDLVGDQKKALKEVQVESERPQQQSLHTQTDPPEDLALNSSTKKSLPTKDSSCQTIKHFDPIVQDETVLSNNESSDHQAYIKSSPAPEIPRKKNFVAQFESPQNVDSNINDCDINKFNHICEHDRKCSPGSPKNQETDKDFEGSVTNARVDIDLTNSHIESNQIVPAHIEDDCNVSQTVTDMINDCLDNVDLESRQEEQLDIRKKSTIIERKLTKQSEIYLGSNSQAARKPPTEIVLDDSIDNVDDIVSLNIDIDSRNSINVDDEIRQDQASIPFRVTPKKECLVKRDVQLTEAISGLKKSTNKRRNTTDHNPSARKIRKSTSKDKSTRKVANKSMDDMQNIVSDRMNSNMSILANNDQQIRQNKIFAKWSDNHFYPGTILKPAKDRKYVIGFLDGAQRNVAETDLIPLCNIEGKQVRVSIAKNYCVNAIVHDQSSTINDQPMFDVEYQQDGLVRKCVPFKDIFLTGEQGTPLINQADRNPGASNFADVDLDNIIYEKRSRRLQEMSDFELTEKSTNSGSKRKRGQYNMRNITNPNSNPPSESSSSTGSSNAPNVLELGQEFYFASTSPHRTNTSLLL